MFGLRQCIKALIYCVAMFCGFLAVLRFYIKQRIFLHRVPNFQEVEKSVLMRGGQPSFSGLTELAEQGIKTVINLRKYRPFFQRKIKELRTIHIPFSPYQPSDQIVIHFLRVLNDPLYQPAYVHCFHGADRTGTLCAIYRIVCQNWDKESAIKEMKSRGLHWWHKNLVEYIRNLDIPRIRSQIGLPFAEKISF